MKSLLIILLSFVVLKATAQTTYEKQIRDITTELSKKVAESNKKKVAVADFTDTDGSVTKLGKFIAEEFNTYLPEAGQGFEVIDRSRINVLIKENQLLRKGLTDPTAAAQLGKLAGIDALIFGTLTAFGESVRVNIKVLDIQRGVILRSLVGNITRTADINKLLSETISVPDDPIPEPPISGSKKSSADCEEKRTCTICVSNKSSISIETNGYHSLDGEELRKLIHPNTTECWKNVPIPENGDYFKTWLYYSKSGNQLKNDELLLEPCGIYNLVFVK